jgi:hypothetical protein
MFGKKNPLTIISGGSWIFPKAKDNVEVSVIRGKDGMIGFAHKSTEKFFYLREIIMEKEAADTGKLEVAGAVFGAAKSLLAGGNMWAAKSGAKSGRKAGKELRGESTAKLRLFDPEDNNEFQILIDCPSETHTMLSNFIVAE